MFILEKAMKAQKGVEVKLYSFFNLGATWGWVVNATPQPLYPLERPSTHCVGGWVDTRASLKGCRKSHPPLRFEPQPVESCYTDCVIPAHKIIIDNYKIYYPCLYISILRQILCGLGLDTAFPLCVNTMMSGMFPAQSAAATD